jgi:hypothetical protein
VNISIVQAIAFGLAFGAGGTLASWCLESLRDFVEGFLEARSGKLDAHREAHEAHERAVQRRHEETVEITKRLIASQNALAAAAKDELPELPPSDPSSPDVS